MHELLYILWEACYWFAPAGVANMAPVFASRIPGISRWNTPADLHTKIKGKRILGDHKTWRGLVVGVGAGTIAAHLQYHFFPSVIFAQSDIHPSVFGFLVSFGALFGDMLKSYFKRRQGIASGKSWFPYDQIDYILGGFLCIIPLVNVSWGFLALTACIYFALHLITSYIGYRMKLKDTPI